MTILRHRPLLLALAALVACTTSMPPLPPPPRGVQRIAVQLPSNRTGRELVVDDPGMIGRYLGEERSTVPGVLAADLRALLADRGFRVMAGAAGDVPTLQIEIRRWEPYTADYSQVTVSLVATLVDPANGQTLWRAERTDWPVSTSQSRNAPEASSTACRGIARALIEGWQPAGAPAATP